MFRYRLRTLLILTILGPPVLAWLWWLGVTPAVVAVLLAVLFGTLAIIASIAVAVPFINAVEWIADRFDSPSGKP